MDQAVVMEALRRRMGQPASGAGLPGGMPASNSPAPGNPVAQMGMNPMQAVGQSKMMPQSPTAGNQSGGAQDMLKSAQPGEAQMIIKSLTKRLESLPPGA
jgi:hypothetical protein